MNCFRVAKGSEAAFEPVPGLEEFRLLAGPEAEDHTLYASHTVWENRAVFEACRAQSGRRQQAVYLDHPQFEVFEVRQTVGRGKAA